MPDPRRGRRQRPAAALLRGGWGGAGTGRSVQPPPPESRSGRETTRRKENNREKTSPFSPETDGKRPPLRRRPGGCGREEEKLLRDELSPAVFFSEAPQRQPEPCLTNGQKMIPASSSLLGNGEGSARRNASPSEPSTKSEILRWVQ